jgi:hypothetical protein
MAAMILRIINAGKNPSSNLPELSNPFTINPTAPDMQTKKNSTQRRVDIVRLHEPQGEVQGIGISSGRINPALPPVAGYVTD